MKKTLDKLIENAILKSNLWSHKIEKDCRSQKVFFTIRDNRIDLYHKGGLLFKFNSIGYSTHIKYASIFTPVNEKDTYISEIQLANYRVPSNFETVYERIKENCSKYSGKEVDGVSYVYHKYSYLSENNVVVLDREVSFESEDEEKDHDRIDLVLLNKTTKTLQFIEAKHYPNQEILSETTPKVLGQLKRYESQIRSRKNEILSEYGALVRSINRIFGITLPEPIDFDPKVTLLIFGFDDDQKNGRLRKRVIENPQYKGIKVYAKGSIKDVKPENIWNKKEL